MSYKILRAITAVTLYLHVYSCRIETSYLLLVIEVQHKPKVYDMQVNIVSEKVRLP
jgi:hypothetical protein